MANVNVKEVNGGEVSTPANSTDGVLLDTGTTSIWISVANLATYVWGYLTSLTAKTTPVDADTLGINDSAASNVGKKVTLANFAIYIYGYLTSLTAKVTPVDADQLVIADSAASNVGKKVTLSNFSVYVWNYLTSLTAKTTLVDADQIGIADSAASNIGKKITWQNLMSMAAAYTQTLTNKTLTAPTIADFTNANHDHLDADDGGVINRGYSLPAQQGIFSPADSTTYYFGQPIRGVGQTTEGHRKMPIPITGTVTRAYISITNGAGTVGTTETSTLSFRLNATTDTALSSAMINNQASETTTTISVTGLSIAVTTGDTFELKWVTPAWVTNPTNVVISVFLWINT
jgi:hypothetical protein